MDKAPAEQHRSTGDRVAVLLAGFFSSTDSIRAMPRLSLIQRTVPAEDDDSTIDIQESAKSHFVREVCLARSLRTSSSEMVSTSTKEIDEITRAVGKCIDFITDEDGRVAVSPKTSDGHRYIREAVRGQRTLREIVRLTERSLLFLLASVSEVFAGQILRIHFREHPSALGEQTLSITELSRFTDIREAMEHAVDQKVESIMRKSAAEWLAKVLDLLHIPMELIKDKRDAFDEIFARRNTLIHNDGEVTGQYLSRCPKYAQSHGIARGSRLSVDPEYLAESIDTCVSILAYLGYAFLFQVDKTDDDRRAGLLNNQTIKELECDRFKLAADLCTIIEKDACADEESKLIAMINFAQARKWAGDVEGCLDALSKYDWVTRQDKYQLAVAVLQEDFDQAKSLAGRCLKSEQLSTDDLLSWPLFRHCRERGLFDDLLDSESPVPTYDSDVTR